MLNIKQKINLHNEFTIEVRDINTNKLKQIGKAYNIILNQGLDQIVRHFGDNLNTIGSDSNLYLQIMRAQYLVGDNIRFGGYIHLGSGVGTLSPSRVQLFNFISSKITNYHDHNYNINNLIGYYTQKAIWEAAELVNYQITEVGLGSQLSSNKLSTHALIEDSEGNPISILKTSMDVLTVYAKTYITINNNYGNNFGYINGSGNNDCNLLLGVFALNGNATFTGTSIVYNRYNFAVGSNKMPINLNNNYVMLNQGENIIRFDNIISNYTNKSVTISTRFNTNQANSKIWEIGVRSFQNGTYERISSGIRNMFRSVMPIPGVYEGHTFTNEEVGFGDAIQTEYNFKWDELRLNSETVYVDGFEQVKNVHYRMNYGRKLINHQTYTVRSASNTFTGTSVNSILDGSLSTFWETQATLPQWVQVDMIYDYELMNKLRIYSLLNTGINAFELRGSNDLSTWDVIVDSNCTNATGWNEFTFNEVAYRYYRIVVKSSYHSTNRCIYEIELHGASTIKFFTPPASGLAVTADYSVDYIPKDSDHVLDISFTLQFGDGNV